MDERKRQERTSRGTKSQREREEGRVGEKAAKTEEEDDERMMTEDKEEKG